MVEEGYPLVDCFCIARLNSLIVFVASVVRGENAAPATWGEIAAVVIGHISFIYGGIVL